MHRAVIIGCGSISTAHAYGITRAEGVELAGLVDIRLEAAVALGARFGAPESACYADMRQALDELRPDIAVVAVWHGQHAEATMASAARGVRLVLCEKPMATSLGEASDMMVACAREGVKLAVAHQRRFFPGWEAARSLVAEGGIGRPLHTVLRVRDGLLNSATHSIDLARFVLGDPHTVAVTASVQRRTDRYERGLRAEDSALAMVELADGSRLFVESDLGSPYVSANATIVGTDGMLSIEENHVRVMNGRAPGWAVVSGAPFGTDDPSVVPDELARPLYELVAHFGTANIEPFVDNYVRQIQAAVDWLDGSLDRHRGDASEGYRTLEVLMGIYESARLRETVHCPVETRVYPLDLLVESGALPVTRPGRYDIRSSLVRGEGMSWS